MPPRPVSALGWAAPLSAKGTRPLSQQQARPAASQTGQRLSLFLTPRPGGPENRPGPRYSKYARGLCYSECGLQTSSTWEPVSNARPHVLNQNLHLIAARCFVSWRRTGEQALGSSSPDSSARGLAAKSSAGSLEAGATHRAASVPHLLFLGPARIIISLFYPHDLPYYSFSSTSQSNQQTLQCLDFKKRVYQHLGRAT